MRSTCSVVANANEPVLTRFSSPLNSCFFLIHFFPQISMSVRQKRPTVLMAATTLWAPTPAFATLPMSWDLMESSATVR